MDVHILLQISIKCEFQLRVCTLCKTAINKSHSETIQEEFCCKGCLVVYQILEARKELENYKTHPIFQKALEAGLIADQKPYQGVPHNGEKKELKRLNLAIGGMWCPSCAHLIRLILLRKKGIDSAAIDYSTDIGVIDYDPKCVSQEKIFGWIKGLGYEPDLLKDPRDVAVSVQLSLRLIVAAFFSFNLMMFAYPIYANAIDGGGKEYATFFAYLSLLGALPVLLYSGWPIWRRFWNGLKAGILGMEALVFLGVFSAAGLSVYELLQGNQAVYFDSLSVIIFFVLLGKVLESKAKFKAKDSLVRLHLALPKRGRKRFPNGLEEFVSIKAFSIGDLFVVHTGEKIILDGVVEEGRGGCDESLMTGEALAVSKQKGDFVIGGSFLEKGSLVIRVTASQEETAFHQIIEMVSKDLGHKSRYVRPVDKIVAWFIPIVCIVAALTAFISFYFGIQDADQTVLQTAIIRAVSVLLISCPCAIGIAVPLAESNLLNFLAKAGIIVRNRAVFSFLGKETVYLFDKTGTLTEGKCLVRSGLEALSMEEKMALKGLTEKSIHPLSMAVNKALLVFAPAFEKIEEIVGRGMRGTYEGKEYLLGSDVFLKEEGTHVPSSLSDSFSMPTSFVYFACEKKLIASIQISDTMREGVKESLEALGGRLILISGDKASSAEKVAGLSGIKEFVAGCHPLEKCAFVEKLKKQGEIVAMFGDGVNDAAALAAAHIGIAAPSATDISVQGSDIFFTNTHFRSFLTLRQAALKARKIIKQNLFWAFFYNLIGILLASMGYLSPLFAAFAMVASSLIVLFNARRLC